MRASTAGLAIVAALVLTSCGEREQRSAMAPSLRSAISVPEPPAGCMSVFQIDSAIPTVFPSGPAQDWVTVQFDSIVTLIGPIVGGPDSAAAHQKALAVSAFIIQQYHAGALIGGTSDATRAAAAELINGFLCLPGLTPDFSAAALDSDGAAVLITDSTPDTTVVTPDKFAGVQLDSGSVPQTVLLTITRLPDSPGPLLTQLDQYPLYYEFHVTPQVPFTLPVLVGGCLAGNVSPPDPSRLRLAHNIAPYTPGSIEILAFQAVPFLDCTNAIVTGSRSANPLVNLASSVWRAARSLFAPERLMAAAGGVGGTVHTFSPFGLVDTLAVMTPNSPTNQTGAPGAAVAAPPSVLVQTPTGHPITGLPVDFEITAGGGTLAGGSATTDASGVASTSSWTLGPLAGINAVTATGTPPQTGSGVAGSPLTFTATAVSPLGVLVHCPPSWGAGDDLSHAFYLPSYPGTSLADVYLYLSENGRDRDSRLGTTYTIQLIARSGGYDGPVIGTSTANVTLHGGAAENQRTRFDFAGAPAVARNSTVAFQFQVVSNPNRATLRFDVGSCGIGDRWCRSQCPVVETSDAHWPLSTFRRRSCAITIIGAGGDDTHHWGR